MATEKNKAIVRRFYKAFENNDLDALRELLAPEFVAYNPDPQNRDSHLQGISMWNASFGENRFEIEDQIAERNRVATKVTLRCIHSKADYQGVPPTGKQIEMPAVTIEHIKDGKIAERRVYSEKLRMLQQYGLEQLLPIDTN